MEQENKVDYLKIEYNKEWFENNKAHTIYDVTLWKIKDASNIIHPGDHFLLDLYPVDEKSSDVEIWEVILTGIELYDKIRKDFSIVI